MTHRLGIQQAQNVEADVPAEQQGIHGCNENPSAAVLLAALFPLVQRLPLV
jgi:hypothetical protein